MAILKNSPKSPVFSRTYIRNGREVDDYVMYAQHEFCPYNPLALGGRDMHEDALMRYSEAVGNATHMAAQEELSPTLMVACLTRFIDVVVRCADDDGFSPNWGQSPTGFPPHDGADLNDDERQHASVA